MGDRRRDDEFREFVLGTQGRLLHFADLISGDRGRAEDLVQLALYKTYLVWGRMRAHRPEAYARTVIVNGHNDWWRRRSARERPTGDLPEQPSTADPATRMEQREAVLAALSTLTRRERTVVVLRYYVELTEAETARELRCPVGTVKSTAARALSKLRAATPIAEVLR